MKGHSCNICYIKEQMTIKKGLVILLLALDCVYSFGQKVISLTKQNGVYTIPCSINGVKRSLVFDTGASSITISMQLAELLYKTGKLNDTDIKGFGKSQTASGHIVNNMAVVLRDVEISGLHLKNVDAVVINGQNVPLLLGLSAIQKLGKVTLVENKLIIESSLLSNTQLNQIRNRIKTYIETDRYSDAIPLLKELENQEVLLEEDLYNMIMCFCSLRDYNRTLMYSQQWMGLYENQESKYESGVCYFMAIAYMGLKSHYDADRWFSKAIRLVSIDPIAQTSNIDANILSHYYNQKALNYLEGNAYENCIEAFDIAAQYRMKYLGATPDDIFAGNLKDSRIGTWLESISKLYAVYLNDEEKSEHYAIMAALCGNEEAIDVCKHFGLDYSPKEIEK